MLGMLLSLFNPLSAIADKIAAAYVAKQNAATDREKIAAEERIKGLEAKRDVLIAEGRFPFNALMRAFMALPVAILMWKLLVWDKAFGQWTDGSTDKLSPEIWYVIMVVAGFYFVHDTVRAWRR